MIIFVVSMLGIFAGALAGYFELYTPRSLPEVLLVALPCGMCEMFIIGKLIKRFERLAFLDKLRLDNDPFPFFFVAFAAAAYVVSNPPSL